MSDITTSEVANTNAGPAAIARGNSSPKAEYVCKLARRIAPLHPGRPPPLLATAGEKSGLAVLNGFLDGILRLCQSDEQLF